MNINYEAVNALYDQLNDETKQFVDMSVRKIIEAKKKNGKVVVATGSGPNIHEGVTTLIAELMEKGVIDGVTTSSAVISHEMGGVLDKVKRVDANKIKEYIDVTDMPRGNIFEFTEMSKEELNEVRKELLLDEDLMKAASQIEGSVIIKAAGNMAYPMGLRTEKISHEIESFARTYGMTFENVAGWGADRSTMIGVGARKGIPVLVSVPQLIGGGTVGMCIADSIPNTQRSARVAQMMEDADVIIESAVVLTQEIHDGPYETYTGHGIWPRWMGYRTYSLDGKTIIRIDLDENLKKAWELDKKSGTIQEAINKGLPKTKLSNIPFRMEMSAFSRLENSIPIVGDIGVVWPILALKVCSELGIKLDFMSYPQQTPEGEMMREYIINEIKPVNRENITNKMKKYRFKY